MKTEDNIVILQLYRGMTESKTTKELLRCIYDASGFCGEFQHRIIWKTGKDRFNTCAPNGSIENISAGQLLAIKEKSDKGQLSAGGKTCFLVPLKLADRDEDETGYWIVAADSITSARELAPFIALAVDNMARVPRSSFSSSQLAKYQDFLSKTAPVLSVDTPLAIADRLADLFSMSPGFYSLTAGVRTGMAYNLSMVGKNGTALTKSIPKDLVFISRDNDGRLSLSENDLFEITKRLEIPSGCFLTFSGFCPENGRPVFFILASLEQTDETIARGILSHLSEYFSILDKAKEQTEEAFKKVETIGSAFNLLAIQNETQQLILDFLDTGTILIRHSGELLFVNKMARMHLGITKVETVEKMIFRSKEPGISLFAMIEKVKEEKKPARSPILIGDSTIDILIAEIEPDLYFITSSDFTQMKKEIDSRKNLFSLVTHEVKNPLTAILNASDLLHSGRAGEFADERQKRLSDIIHRSSVSMKQVLDDVSSYGKAILGSGKDSWASLKTIIDNTVNEKHPLAKAKNIKIVADLQDCSVLGPDGMAETLLSNIIGNAIKYSIVGGNIGIILKEQGDLIALDVIDDGIGIPPADLQKIGEPFFRAQNTRNTISGTGFGLVIVKNIVERLRGTLKFVSPIDSGDRNLIGCSNEKQRGTKVEIRFPFIRR